MSYAAINEMVNTLGDAGHSRFVDPQTAQGSQPVNGKYNGIGIVLHQDTKTTRWIIDAPVPNAPADKAGIKSGDIIITFNGMDVAGKDANVINGLIHGPVGTNVTLVIQRPGENQTRTFTMTMALIDVPNVIMHYIPESHIAHIQVVVFATGVASDVRNNINKAKALGA